MKIEKYQKILIGITLIAILLGLKAPQIKADTVNYTYKQYRVQYYSLGQGTTTWNSWTNFGTSSPFSEGYGVSSLAVRFGQSSDFTSGNTYRIVIDSGFSPQSEKQYISYSGSSCYGSASTSSWSNVEIADCEYIGMADTPNSVHRKFVFDVTPSVNYKGIQININFSGTAEIRGVNVYSSSTISTGPDITGAIDEQTLIIEDGFQDITNIINQTNEDLINAITEQNQVCEMIDRNNTIQSGYLTSSGDIASSSAFKITDYIKIDNNSKLTLLETYTAYNTPNICFYNTNKTLISCVAISTIQQNANITIPNNSSYVRISINYDWNRPQLKLCKNGNQAIIDQDHNYNGADIGTQVDQYEQQEEELETITDIDLTDRLTLNWNTGTLSWIWNTFDTIRGSYLKVFALMTSFLALGIIRLVLGR